MHGLRVAKPSCCGLDSRFMLGFLRKKQKDIVVRLPGHLVASEEISAASAKQNHYLNGKLEI